MARTDQSSGSRSSSSSGRAAGSSSSTPHKDATGKRSHEPGPGTSNGSSGGGSSGEKHRHHHHHHHQDQGHKSHKRHKVERQPSALKLDVKLEPLNHSDILGDLNSSLFSGYDEAVLSASATATRRSGHAVKQEYDPNLGVTSRKARTMVYAGHSRAAHYDHVPRLEDLCLSLLSDNLDKITCVGDAPFYLMKRVFAKCTPAQLRRIEKHNSANLTLMQDMDDLWKMHAEQEFRDEMKQRSKRESWRDFFHRVTRERENRLMKITKRIQKKKVQDEEPVKKTLVVESVPQKGRRLPASTKSASHATAVSAADIKKSAKESRVGAAAKAKHRTGPLMAKTMQMFKQRFRR